MALWLSKYLSRLTLIPVFVSLALIIEQIASSMSLGQSFFSFIVLLHALLFVFISAVGLAVFHTISKRSAQAAKILEAVHAVEHKKDLTQEIEIISRDGIGKIGIALNKAFSSIRRDFSTFVHSANEIGAASEQTGTTVKQSRNNLLQLQKDISQIAHAAQKMNLDVSQVQERMEHAANSAEEATNESQHGEQAVVLAVEDISKTANEVKQVGATVEELNRRVEDILGMVDVIRSVADQTNLLALNAAIEAARAGEQGRGFAVVADEVRALAKRTQTSTEEIATVVNHLQESSQLAFKSIEQGSQQAASAVEKANNISQVLSNVVVNIKSVDQVTKQVSTSTGEQNKAIVDINTNASSINGQAEQNVKNAEQLASASEQLSQAVEQINQRLNSYKIA